MTTLHRVRLGLAVRTAVQRENVVQEPAHAGDHAIAADRVVRAGRRRITQRVGAVEDVVERSPARVRGVERVARVGHRHDELRPRDLRDLRVHALRVDQKVRALRLQIAQLFEKRPVRIEIERAAAVLAVPAVDRGLQLQPAFQQGAVTRSDLVDQIRQALPESSRLHPGTGQRLLLDEAMQDVGNAEPRDLNLLCFAHGDLRSRIEVASYRRGRLARTTPVAAARPQRHAQRRPTGQASSGFSSDAPLPANGRSCGAEL